MRNQTQERVEALARERALTAIDLGLVEEGIEIGKKIMAEVIAIYPTCGQGRGGGGGGSPGGPARRAHGCGSPKQEYCGRPGKAQVVPAVGSGYLNEVSALTVPNNLATIASTDPSRTAARAKTLP